ncbi:MAG: FtsH-binding integral membrane protein [Oceanicoccus sp.]|jgi:FtsH-binding integral membrane protein
MNLYNPAVAQSNDFLNKVLSVFGLAMLVTAGGVYVGFQYLLPVFAANPLIMYGLFALELGLIFTSRMWHKKEPLNRLLFSLFTFISGLTIVPLIASFAIEFGGYDIIFNALFSTTVMFFAMAMIGWTIKKPLTGMRGFLTMGLIGMIVVSIIGIFIPWGNTGEMLVSGFGVVLFAGYTMYDIQNLKNYQEDQYILAAMQLYLDIFNLFIFILRLTGATSRD